MLNGGGKVLFAHARAQEIGTEEKNNGQPSTITTLREYRNLYEPNYWKVPAPNRRKLNLATRLILKWASAKENSKIIDVGCGSGRLMIEFNCFYVGIDVFSEPLWSAKELLTDNAHLTQASGDRIPFKDAVFDVAICIHTLEHIPNWTGVLNEISRVLKPKGRLVLSFPNRSYFLFKLRLVKQPRTHFHAFDYNFNDPNFRAIETRTFYRAITKIPFFWRYLYDCVILLEKAQ